MNVFSAPIRSARRKRRFVPLIGCRKNIQHSGQRPDPNRRGASSGQRLGSGEYFGTHAEVSTEYCGGGRQMIVFAVLTDPRSTREGGKIVVSSDVSHQLPLCTVHIANRTPPRPTERALKVTNAAERALIRKERKRGWPFG